MKGQSKGRTRVASTGILASARPFVSPPVRVVAAATRSKIGEIEVSFRLGVRGSPAAGPLDDEENPFVPDGGVTPLAVRFRTVGAERADARFAVVGKISR